MYTIICHKLYIFRHTNVTDFPLGTKLHYTMPMLDLLREKFRSVLGHHFRWVKWSVGLQLGKSTTLDVGVGEAGVVPHWRLASPSQTAVSE